MKGRHMSKKFTNTLHSFLLLIRLLLARLLHTLFSSLACFIIQPRHPTPPPLLLKTVKTVNPHVKPRAISLSSKKDVFLGKVAHGICL